VGDVEIGCSQRSTHDEAGVKVVVRGVARVGTMLSKEETTMVVTSPVDIVENVGICQYGVCNR
jgi:hypothetical protein